MAFARLHLSIFTPEQEKHIAYGILAEAVRCNLDPTVEIQRKEAARSLLDKMDWTGTGITEGMYNLASLRTRQLCEEMTVAKELVKELYLMAGGRGGIVYVAGIPMVSLPIGMAQRREPAGEYPDRTVFVGKYHIELRSESQ